MADPIVVTGMGLVTPLGCGVGPVWERLISGRFGIGRNDRIEVEDLPPQIAGLVPSAEEDPHGLDPDRVVSVKDRKKIDLFTLYGLAAAEEALQQAGWKPEDQASRDRTATVIATGIGGFPVMTQAERTLDSRSHRRQSPFVIPAFLGNLAAGNISIRYGFRGPIGAPITACAAGLQAIGGTIRHTLRRGVGLASGTEACIDRLAIAGFNAARALSTENDVPEAASRPYDRSRSGFVLSGGRRACRSRAAVARRKQGRQTACDRTGYGTSADAYHLTAGPDDGSGAALAIAATLADAGVAAEQVGYVNGHATCSPVGDAGEIAALRSIFKENLPAIPISSTKSATGHLLGAAGGVEAIFTILALTNGQLPPTLNFRQADDGAEDLDFISDLNRKTDAPLAICNAFGFGGVNASAVLQKVGSAD